jgi:mannose-6-phosphate isomerase
MDWYPLKLTNSLAHHVFGGRQIADRLGRAGLPDRSVAETWEISDWDERISVVREGPLAGRSLRDLTQSFPDALVAPGWNGPRFPILTKFIDGSGMLPVHLHADDETARRRWNQPNGKTEAWHILWAAPDATILIGLKQELSRAQIRAALLDQDYDRIMLRRPIASGDTVYVPGGTLHSFGPNTLVYEIEQTSDIQQNAMPIRMEDGSPLPREEWEANVDALLDELKTDPQPRPHAGLVLRGDDGLVRRICTASPFFALERWQVPGRHLHGFAKAQVLSNIGAPFRLSWSGGETLLERAETVLLPAALGEIMLDGPAELLVGYVPDLIDDIRVPLVSAGYQADAIGALGDVFDQSTGAA